MKNKRNDYMNVMLTDSDLAKIVGGAPTIAQPTTHKNIIQRAEAAVMRAENYVAKLQWVLGLGGFHKSDPE